MRALAPVTRVDGGSVSVTVAVLDDAGDPRPDLVTTVAVEHVDGLDPTAGPALPVLVAAAVAAGEDLRVGGSVDVEDLSAARALASHLAARSGRPTPRVEPDVTHTATAGAGAGLLFAGGPGAAASLIEALASPAADRTTHLVHVGHPDRPARGSDAARRAAARHHLPLVEVTTTAADLLAGSAAEVHGPLLVAAARAAAGRRGGVVLACPPGGAGATSATTPEVLALLSTSSRPVGSGTERGLIDRLRLVLSEPAARQDLTVCACSTGAPGCGRCPRCQLTMAALVLAGDPVPSHGFAHPPDPALVRATTWGPEAIEVLRPLAEDLPPAHEDLRRAWADVLARVAGAEVRSRWGDGAPPPLAGPSVATRVAAALRASTGTADAPTPRPLGWRRGSVPLRPAFSAHDEVRAAHLHADARPRPWAVVEPHIRDDDRDGSQAELARRLHHHLGAGALYLPGILWAGDAPPALGADAVRRLLGTARARLWWREDGDLEPLRVVESVECGCVPFQVMPAPAARRLRSELPEALAVCVVSGDQLAALDLTAEALAPTRRRVVDHVLAGSAERDLMAGAHGG